ncbi:MAG TPA: hypothetical protein VGS19_38770 [Streptosporangiaceae bacterium]|nr:hypothetical protein [Streptosporangiaceae bacterium]
MLTEDQLADRLRTRLREETAMVQPSPDLLAVLRRRQARRSVTMWAGIAAVPVTAAGAAVAAVLAVTGPVSPALPHRSPVAGGPGHVLSARDILLSAAVSAAKVPAAGRYWVMGDQRMRLQPAGTAAHPYDIAERSSTQSWYPRSARQRYWYIVKDGGARPATSADVAAWRAVGSPASWVFGGLQHGLAAQRFTMSGSPEQAFWQPRDEALGFLAGNQRATFARLQALPSSVARLRAFLVRDVAGGSSRRMTSTLAAEVFGSGVWFLTEPVTSQVHASVYKVLAALPGVQTVGRMTDPLGRPGYGVEIPQGGGENEVIVVSPATGELLADELVVATPGRTRVEQWASSCRDVHQLSLKGLSKAQRARVLKAMPSAAECARLARDGSRYVQYGPRYQGQVAQYDAYTRVGWTNDSPHLPAARSGPGSAQG